MIIITTIINTITTIITITAITITPAPALPECHRRALNPGQSLAPEQSRT
jgi:hypothetical protein